MNSKEKYIHAPLDEKKVRDLKAGDFVYITGDDLYGEGCGS